MVMESPHRVLTVEEARNLPPPSPELIEHRRRALARAEAFSDGLKAEIRSRLGRDLSQDELESLLGRDGESDSN